MKPSCSFATHTALAKLCGFRLFSICFGGFDWVPVFAGSWSGFFGNMYPVYFRGLAYLAEGRSAEAAAEFQKILDHPGLVFADPAAAVSRLQLARARVKGGNRASAKAAYDDFFKLWKSADADLPILKRAREEYARLL